MMFGPFWKRMFSGVSDPEITNICVREGRVLVTIDLDFADIRAFPLENNPGVIVLRVPRQDIDSIVETFRRALDLLDREPIERSLWIVEPSGVRIRSIRSRHTDDAES